MARTPPRRDVEQSGRRQFIVLLVVFFLSLAVRLIWWRLGPQVIESEGAYYARLAENLAAGRGYVGLRESGLQLIYPPLYPALIAAGIHLGLASEAAGRAVSLVFGAGFPVVVFLLTRRLYGVAPARLAGALAVIHPLLVVLSVAVLSEATSMTLSLLGVFFIVRIMDEEAHRDAIAAGVCLGAAYLCRPEALVVVLLLGLVVIGAARDRRRAAALRVGTLMAVFGILALPYIAFLSLYTGQLRFEAKTPDAVAYLQRRDAGEDPNQIYSAIDANLKETGTSNVSNLALIQGTHVSVTGQFLLFVRAARENVPALERGLAAPFFGQPFIAMLAALGIFTAPWSRRRAQMELPLIVASGVTLVSVVTWPFLHDRFFYPLSALLLVWSGQGLEWFWRWARGTATSLGASDSLAAKLGVVVLPLWVCLLVIASAVGIRATDEVSQSWSGLKEDRMLGEWLDVAGARRALIMDAGPTVAYYSGAAIVPFPWTDGPTALRYITEKRVDFVIVRNADIQSRPYFADWTQGLPDAHAELIRVFHGASGDIRIYRWRA